MKKTSIHIFFILLLLGIDQLTKYFADLYLKNQSDYTLIDGVFSLHYLENRGSAFGLFQDQRVFFIVITILVLAILPYLFFKLPDTKRYFPLRLDLCFLFAGAVGNLIDRIAHVYVIDFFYFELIDFPVFNVADIYITVSTIILFILLIFYYKENDFDFLKRKKEQQ